MIVPQADFQPRINKANILAQAQHHRVTLIVFYIRTIVFFFVLILNGTFSITNLFLKLTVPRTVVVNLVFPGLQLVWKTI